WWDARRAERSRARRRWRLLAAADHDDGGVARQRAAGKALGPGGVDDVRGAFDVAHELACGVVRPHRGRIAASRAGVADERAPAAPAPHHEAEATRRGQ